MTALNPVTVLRLLLTISVVFYDQSTSSLFYNTWDYYFFNLFEIGKSIMPFQRSIGVAFG